MGWASKEHRSEWKKNNKNKVRKDKRNYHRRHHSQLTDRHIVHLIRTRHNVPNPSPSLIALKKTQLIMYRFLYPKPKTFDSYRSIMLKLNNLVKEEKKRTIKGL